MRAVRLEGAVLVMTAPDISSVAPAVQPNAGIIAAFMDVVFGYCEVPRRADALFNNVAGRFLSFDIMFSFPSGQTHPRCVIRFAFNFD
jgi:hypothetical protein